MFRVYVKGFIAPKTLINDFDSLTKQKNQNIAEQMELGLIRLSKGKWQHSAFPDS